MELDVQRMMKRRRKKMKTRREIASKSTQTTKNKNSREKI